MIRKVDAKEPAQLREDRIRQYWQENRVFQQSEQNRTGAPEFVFYEGPPTANGKPHPGHVLTRVMKDVYPRYKTMKGFHVQRKAGWDTHGLPVEIEIEKKYGISGKKQIQEFGVERFINECRNGVFTYEETWREMSDRLGFWLDFDHPYMTLTDDYIESVWNLLQTIYEQGRLYQGHRVSPYCPHCETTLSSHEVAQGYKDVKDLTVTAKFRITQPAQPKPTFILAWTTTPWTLPSNVGLAVNPDLQYALVQSAETGERYWVANELSANFLKEGDEIVDKKLGQALLGWRYEPLFDYVKTEGEKFVIIPSGHVTADSGTGVVHMAPAFGEDDYRACRAAGLVFTNFVDINGHFTDDVTDFAGRFVRDEATNVDIVKNLAARNLVYDKYRHEHSYPHCWRCDTPLLYYAIDSWFIKTTDVKEEIIANSRGVNWIPDHIKEGRMGDFLENLIDWNLSRSRFWGTPLPIWVCKDCSHEQCVGSKQELLEKAGRLPKELHKPYIDELTWQCSCGGTMERVSHVIDVWFDSGSMPFAQLHYPFENQDAFERLYPADYICEAIDQTRGWFYSLLAISTLVKGRAPYKNVLVLGHVLDEEGKKMSKSKGNVIDPMEAFDRHGADAIRFYFLTNTQPWNSQRFYHKAVAESKAKFIDLLQNVHAFYALYAGIDKFNPLYHAHNPDVSPSRRPLMDRWILSRLNDVVRKVDAWLDEYDATSAARALQDLAADVSQWYVRRSRDRFWAPGMEADKVAAYLTLYEVLGTMAKLIAPFTPFLAEEIYQNVVRLGTEEAAGSSTGEEDGVHGADKKNVPDVPESVHLCDFPAADAALIDETLLYEMDQVVRVVETARHLRNESKIKTRQPLSTLYAPKGSSAVLSKFADIIEDELNVKAVEFVDLNEVANAEIYLNLKAVGQEFGKLVPVLNAAAKAASPDQVATFAKTGEVTFEGHIISRDAGHAELRYQPSFPGLIETMPSGGFVGLNTELTDELIEEGYVREIISKMQMMRKEVNYNVTDHVLFAAEGDAEMLAILHRNTERIQKTVLIRNLVEGAHDGDLTKDWDVNGKPLTLTVKG